MGYSFRLASRVLLYAPSHRQDSTYHGLCYTSCGALAGTKIAQWVHPMKDRSDDPSHHERTLLPRSYIWLLPLNQAACISTFKNQAACISTFKNQAARISTFKNQAARISTFKTATPLDNFASRSPNFSFSYSDVDSSISSFIWFIRFSISFLSPFPYKPNSAGYW